MSDVQGKSILQHQTSRSTNVPQGYKRTEFGVIPDDWGIMRLSDLLDFRNGVNADKGAYGTGVPFINVLEIINHSHLYERSIPGRISLRPKAVDSFLVHRGDILFNRTSETLEEVGLASAYLDDCAVLFGGFVIRGRPRCACLEPQYSGYALRSPGIRSQIIARGQGAIRANIGQADLGQVFAPCPQAYEQRAIGVALLDVDTAIGALEKLVEKKRTVQQAVMRALLTKGEARLPGFTGTWTETTAGEVGRFRGGNAFPRRYQGGLDGAYPFFKVSDMNHRGNEIQMVHAKNWVSRDARSSMGLSVFPANGIIFAKVGAAVFLERKRLLIRPSCIDNNMAAFVVDQAYADHSFLFWWLMTIRLSDLVATTALPSINGHQLRKIPLSLPPLPEQRAIAAILSDMEAEIADLERRRDKTQAIKQGMMEALLTGRVRLVPPSSAQGTAP